MSGLLKKKLQPPGQPGLDGLTDTEPGNLEAHFARLISPSTGIVRKFSRIHKDLSEPQTPYIFRAELANHRFLEERENAFIVGSGKGFTPERAKVSAMGEAVERYSSSAWGEERVLRGRACDLDMEALDPARLVLYRPEQYSDLQYHPYAAEDRLGWVPSRSLGTGQMVAVPALGILMAYETEGAEPYLFPITSNGLAAGPTLADAVLNGALECVERDAFLTTWLHRLPAQGVLVSDHPDPDIRDLVVAYARRGVTLEAYRLPTDTGIHVFMGMAVKNEGVDGPAVVVGLGADPDPAKAAAGALIEVCQVRPALRMRLRQPETKARMADLVADPALVSELEDHDLLYAAPQMLSAFDFLRGGEKVSLDWAAPQGLSTHDHLKALVADLQGIGSDLLYANLTVPDIAFTGAHVVRSVIPDFQPMYFGRSERRLGGKRLFEMPERLGLGPAARGPDDLNPLPHPLA